MHRPRTFTIESASNSEHPTMGFEDHPTRVRHSSPCDDPAQECAIARHLDRYSCLLSTVGFDMFVADPLAVIKETETSASWYIMFPEIRFGLYDVETSLPSVAQTEGKGNVRFAFPQAHTNSL